MVGSGETDPDSRASHGANPGMMVMDCSPLSIGIARRAMLVE
jgi:hypothetical protein